MPVITLTSDFGYQDHYVAAVKAHLLQHCPQVAIVDISHGIEPLNIAQGAHVLKAVYQTFPVKSVHIFAVDGPTAAAKHIAFRWADHYFVGCDNGFAGLLTAEDIGECVDISAAADQQLLFPAQTLYAPVAAQLVQGAALQAVGSSSPTPQKLIARQPRRMPRQIIGHIAHVDHYGNLVSNITQAAFAQQCQGQRFEIRFASESVYTLHTHYTQVSPGDCVCLFNSLSLLEIAIHQGHAATLLGMQVGSPVAISFRQ